MSRYAVNKVCYRIAHDYGERDRFLADPAAFLEGYDLTEEEREAFIKGDFVTLYRMGTNPFLLQQWAARVLPNRNDPNFRYWYAEAVAPYGRPDYRT